MLRLAPLTLFTIALMAAGPTRPNAAGQEFACTEVLGFSQSLEWYAEVSITALDARVGSVELDPDQFLPGWQARFTGGAAVERWKDPEYVGWEGQTRSPDLCPRDRVDRVVFNVSGGARSAAEWAADLHSVIAILRPKYPDARRIVLVPVVGAEPEGCGAVRAAQNHPVVVAGIERAAAEAGDQVLAGPSPTVPSCGHFADRLGHLTLEGAKHVHARLASHFTPAKRPSGLGPSGRSRHRSLY